MTLSRGGLLAASLAFLIAGSLLGTVLAFWQAARLVVGPLTIPWGAIVGVILLVGVIRLATNAVGSRWVGVAIFAGWLVATIVFASSTPWAADIVLSSGARQLGYLLGGVIAGSAAAIIRARVSLPV
jgi:hypothetical protein